MEKKFYQLVDALGLDKTIKMFKKTNPNILDELRSEMKSTSDWISFLDSNNSKLNNCNSIVASEELIKIATNFEDWFRIYNLSPKKDVIAQARIKLFENAKTIKHWFYLFNNQISDAEHSLYISTRDTVYSLANTFENCLYIITNTRRIDPTKEPRHLRETAIKRILKYAQSFGEWNTLYHELSGESYQELAWNNMLKANGTFSEWENVHENYLKYSSHSLYLHIIKEAALEQMALTATSYEECLKVCEYNGGENNIQKIIEKKLNDIIINGK